MATEEKEQVMPAGMRLVGWAVHSGNDRTRRTSLYRRHHDAVNAANGTRSNHYLTGGTVVPVYIMEKDA